MQILHLFNYYFYRKAIFPQGKSWLVITTLESTDDFLKDLEAVDEMNSSDDDDCNSNNEDDD